MPQLAIKRRSRELQHYANLPHSSEAPEIQILLCKKGKRFGYTIARSGGGGMMKAYSALSVVLLFSATATLNADVMVFDRGLPTANLNNAAGANRSNVAWGGYTPSGKYYAEGDTFNFGTTGQTYTITDLRVWIVGSGTTPLSDIFNSLTLSGGGFTPANVNDISTVSTTGDPNVGLKAVQYI